MPDSIARAWAGVGIRADIVRGGIDIGRWDEVRWEEKPGEMRNKIVPGVRQ